MKRKFLAILFLYLFFHNKSYASHFYKCKIDSFSANHKEKNITREADGTIEIFIDDANTYSLAFHDYDGEYESFIEPSINSIVKGKIKITHIEGLASLELEYELFASIHDLEYNEGLVKAYYFDNNGIAHISIKTWEKDLPFNLTSGDLINGIYKGICNL